MDIKNVPPDAPLCSSGKRPFRNEAHARHRLRVARSDRLSDSSGQRRHAGVEEGVYRCPVCQWWHLTSSTRPQRRSTLSGKKKGARRR